MAYSLVAHGVGSSTTSNGFTTGAIDTTGADFIVVAVALGNATPTGTLSDSKSNTWTPLTQGVGSFSDRYIQQFYCEGPTAGTGHTFSISGTANFPSIAVQAFSGGTTSSFDVQNQNANGFNATCTTGSITPGFANEVLIAALAHDDNSVATIDSGFTISDAIPNNGFGFTAIAMAYQIQTTATTRNPTFTVTGGTRVNAAIASFKTAAAGGGIVAKLYQVKQSISRASYW